MQTIRAMLALCTAVLLAGALHYARSVFAPVAFSLLVIALVWPLQQTLETKLPRLLASALVMATTLFVIIALTAVVAWGFSMIAEWLAQYAGKLQSLHLQATQWLERHGISLSGFIAERFDVGWLIRLLQDVAGRMRSLAGFFLLVVILTVIGLLEVDEFKQRLQAMDDRAKGQTILLIVQRVAVKFRKYMLVRSLASMLTGVLIFAFTLFAGLELAAAWGIMAFTLNYIPFIGPFIATILPTVFAIVQFESWQMAALIFLGSTFIQFLIGNYLEPRLSGSVLNISPYLVVFAVFFWAFLWGLPGAFIGVPLTIALLTWCEAYPSSRWIATIFSGRPAQPVDLAS